MPDRLPEQVIHTLEQHPEERKKDNHSKLEGEGYRVIWLEGNSHIYRDKLSKYYQYK